MKLTLILVLVATVMTAMLVSVDANSKGTRYALKRQV